MYDKAEKVLKLATEQGADEAEVYVMNSRSTTADIRKNLVEGSKEAFSKGIGIRAVVNGAVGFASTNIDGHVEEAVNLAVKSAKVRESDPDWSSLPSNSRYSSVKGVFDKQIQEIELDGCIDLALQLIEGARSVDNIVVTSGTFSRSYSKRLILNTNGVEVEEEGTAVSGFVDAITTEGDPSTAYDFKVSRSLDIDFFDIGKNAAQLAVRSQNGICIEPQKTDVILHPFAVSDLLDNAFAPSLDADNVQKGRSSLIGRIGDEIAASDLNLVDDGLLDGGIETSVSDDEGVPSQRTPVIENGVFRSYLYDSYTAGKGNVKSTGNATRNSYLSTPSVGLRNFVVEHPQSDIIGDTDEGVIINSLIGSHTANSISGDFSVEARNAFTIKDGQVDKPIRSLMLSGNIFDVLKNITGAGFDVQKVGGTVTPSIRVSSMSIVG